MADWIRIATVEECAPGQLLGAVAGDVKIVVANVDGDLYALQDRCSHANFPLNDGELEGSELTCVHHGAKFDACTGEARGFPAIRPVRTFEVDVRDGEIYVNVG